MCSSCGEPEYHEKDEAVAEESPQQLVNNCDIGGGNSGEVTDNTEDQKLLVAKNELEGAIAIIRNKQQSREDSKVN